MKKNSFTFLAGLVLIVAMLACSIPSISNNSQPSDDEVSTIVAETLQALTPSVSDAGSTPIPPVADGMLPHALYFLNNDNTGLVQVYRLDTDGTTLHQVTFEPSAVNSYDVSAIDGSVVYTSNNQLLLVNADGSNRRVVLDGGPIDQSKPFGTTISSPVFSPNAQTIAFSYHGLTLYAVSTGTSNLALPQEAGPGGGLEGTTYAPKKYSPDGGKLLISIIIPNSDGSSMGVYIPAGNTLVQLTSDGARLCCSEQAWVSDGSGLFAASDMLGFFTSGLWRLDAATGNSTTLLPSDAGGGNFNLASQPYLAPDGQLYYFYASQPAPDGFIDNPPLQIVRSAADGVTGRTVLRPETFNSLNEALWAPDGSFVITATAPAQGVYQGGIVELYYTDPQKAVLQLSQFGYSLKWGP